MFDHHFPLMKYAFCSEEYYPVILDNTDQITETGLKYVNNDMCCPCILNIGQIICALQSGKYDLKNTLLLMPTFGDRCLGSNYTQMLKKALQKAGISDVSVITFSVRPGEDNKIRMQYFMFMRAFFSMQYGDLLLYLTQQIRPYEAEKGAADRCMQKWIETLSQDFRTGRHLNPLLLKKQFRRIIADFAAIKQTGEQKQRIGIVGELFMRYCALGNRNLVGYLEDAGCETFMNGLSSYFLYYIDCHKSEAEGVLRLGYNLIYRMILTFQKIMMRSLKKAGMFTISDYGTLKRQFGREKMEQESVGDGWLISMDIFGCFRNGIRKILGVQAFRCIPSHIYGRGQYSAMVRKYRGSIVALDYDTGLADVNIQNRIHLLIDRVIE